MLVHAMQALSSGVPSSRHWVRCLGVAALVLALGACAPDDKPDLASPATSPDPSSASFVGSSVARSPEASRARPSTTRSEQTHYIEFRSRSAASYGHTFASVGKLGPGDRIETTEIVGLHPATESVLPWMIGHVLPVVSETGASDGDTEEVYWTARYRVRMNQQRYDDLMVQIRQLQASSPAWHAVFYNCNAFVGDIAKKMGLKTPENTLLFPKEYIEELASLNGA
jgi:hypothetical protein